MTTTTQRVAALRERRKALGQIRVELYLTPEEADAVRAYVASIKKPPRREAKPLNTEETTIRR